MRSKPLSPSILPIFLIGASLLIALGVAFRSRAAPPAHATQPAVETAAQIDETQPPQPIEETATAGPEAPESTGLQLQTAGGLTLEAWNLRFEDDETGVMMKLDLCFPIPSNADWFYEAVLLEFSGSAVSDYGTNPIEIRQVNGDGTVSLTTFDGSRPTTTERPVEPGEDSRRCDTFYFWGLPEEIRHAPLTLTIGAIADAPNEGQTCTADLLSKAQQAMDARANGLTLVCQSDEIAFQQSGYAGLAIGQVPEGMSQETADSLFFNNDFWLDVFGLRGPWVFTFPAR